MGLKDAKEGKLLYHLTELKNLESIIDFGLVPRKILRENTVTFGDVADPGKVWDWTDTFHFIFIHIQLLMWL